MAEAYLCRDCSKLVAATKNQRYRTHEKRRGEKCMASSEPIPRDLLEQGPDDPKVSPEVPVKGKDFERCPECTRNVKLTRLGYFENHNATLYGGDRCKTSGVRAFHSGRTTDVPLPGDTVPRVAAAIPRVTNQEEVEKTTVSQSNLELTPMSEADRETLIVRELGATVLSVEDSPSSEKVPSLATGSPPSISTSGISSPPSIRLEVGSPGLEWSEGLDEFFLLTAHLMLMDALGEPEIPAPASSGTPGPLPGGFDILGEEWKGGPGKVPTLPMDELAKQLAASIKETFYAYTNRKTSDNRSAQTTLGPSEIGTPCDRRLAMALMNISPVNAGGDGWAAFVGTCTHAGMAEVYTFADAGTGRYAVELPVFLGMPSVPRGTTDLLIRQRPDGTVVDWKVMGFSSLKKFKEKGPSDTYRTQAHVYGLGAERAGEKVRNVAIVGLPRGGFSLDEMHIWTEKYDRKFAQAALDRVEKIAQKVAESSTWAGLDVQKVNMQRAAGFPVGDDCTYCPFHLKGDKEMKRGCPGK